MCNIIMQKAVHVLDKLCYFFSIQASHNTRKLTLPYMNYWIDLRNNFNYTQHLAFDHNYVIMEFEVSTISSLYTSV